jgi:hypothetical protein
MTPKPNTPPEETGCGRQLAWFGAGFVLPFYNIDYYLGAIRKPLRSALVFFAALMTLVAALTTVRLTRTFENIREQTIQAFQDGELPIITIEDGVASVDGEDPFILKDPSGFFVAVDTKGELTGSSMLDDFGGMLITDTQLRSYRNGTFQAIELINYNYAFNRNPIVLDDALVDQIFGTVSIIYLIAGGIAVWFWDVVFWLLFLVMVTFFIWGPIARAIPTFTFGAVLTIGIYAHLPAYVVNHILNLFDVAIVFQYTILLMVFWIGGLYLVLRELAEQALQAAKKAEQTEEQIPLPPPLHIKLWPALLGLPVMVFIALNAIYAWEFAPIYILGGLAVTIAVLLFIDNTQANPAMQREE